MSSKEVSSRRSAGGRRIAAPMALTLVWIAATAAGAANSQPNAYRDTATPPAPPAADGVDTGERSFSTTGVRKFRKRQRRPISLGTSGGNVTDLFVDGEFVYCTSGTLGGLVLKNGVPHILSNNHVLARQNQARKGEPIAQPGLIDNRCRDESEDYVGTLEAYRKLKFGGARNNTVDAAIAEVVDGAVDPQGRIQGIGIPGDSVLEPFLGMKVKKAGRTSGVTRGTVILLDATLAIDYGTEENPQSARFVHQLMVSPNRKTFVEPGDSGSVVLFDSDDCPEWVGLLFAGSPDGWGVVNPIRRVFKSLKKLRPRGRVRPVGCFSGTSAASASASANLVRAGTDGAEDVARIERQLRKGRRLVDRMDDELLAIAGVVGLGVGFGGTPDDGIALHVLVTDTHSETVARIPSTIDEMPTRIVETGRFRAFQETCPR